MNLSLQKNSNDLLFLVYDFYGYGPPLSGGTIYFKGLLYIRISHSCFLVALQNIRECPCLQTAVVVVSTVGDCMPVS